MILQPSTPPDLPSDLHLACFASRLLHLSLEERAKAAPPELFSLFTDILTLIPSPPLVDAICLAIDTTLRQPASWKIPEQINWAYVQQVCTPHLAKALCTLVGMGRDFASSSVFAVLRYCVDSVEFKALSALDPAGLVGLCDADEVGVMRRKAQELHILPRLIEYQKHPFPKPEFPLSEESLSALILLYCSRGFEATS
jgi:hypothetical protein